MYGFHEFNLKLQKFLLLFLTAKYNEIVKQSKKLKN